MINYFARTHKLTQAVRLMYEAPKTGPTAFMPPDDDYEDVLLQGPWQYCDPPSDTCKLILVGGVPRWVDSAEMAAAVEVAVRRCYPDIDAIYTAAVGNRQVEYTAAENDARAFLAGLPASENVSCFARRNPTGEAQTNRWAAEQIVAKADAFKSAQVAMRVERFETQSAMRACTTPAELAHVVYLWDQFIAKLRTQLDL